MIYSHNLIRLKTQRSPMATVIATVSANSPLICVSYEVVPTRTREGLSTCACQEVHTMLLHVLACTAQPPSALTATSQSCPSVTKAQVLSSLDLMSRSTMDIHLSLNHHTRYHCRIAHETKQPRLRTAARTMGVCSAWEERLTRASAG